jgi:hypothetical protein
MKTSLNRLSRYGAAMLAAVLLGAAASSPALAQLGAALLPCDAFARNVDGGWRVLAPVMLDFGGRLYSPTVGTVFPAGGAQSGIELSDVLDRACGNR